MLLLNAIPPVLFDVGIIFVLAILVLLICNSFKIPTILGFLLTGILAGPDILNLVRAESNIDVFAEFGVVLLLFSIGIEFSLKDLMRIRRQVFIGGSLQLFLTTLIVASCGYFFDVKLKEAIFIGLLFSLSSTAIVLKIFQERGTLQSPQGRSAMAILIFQDIAVVPIMLLIPYLSSKSSGFDWIFIWVILKGILTVTGVILLSKFIMPKLFFAVAKSKSNELFLLTVLMVCLSVAWLTAQLGLSLSLGAFLAGLIISESEYSHEAFGTILPFRDVFTSFFFISIGLLVDMDYFFSHALIIIAIAICVLIIKTLVAGSAIFLTGHNARIALLAGLFVSQVGEFAFILADSGQEIGVISQPNYQLFLAVSILTMAVTPSLIYKSDRLSAFLNNLLMNESLKKRFPRLIRNSIKQSPASDLKMNDHVVLIGYNESGRNVAKVLRMANIPFVGIDSDPEIVLSARNKKSTPIFYGNATNSAVLKHVSIEKAKAVVISLKHPNEIKSVVSAIKKLSPTCHIIAMTGSLNDMTFILNAGVNEAISVQFETSVEIVTRVLTRYLISRNDIDDFVLRLRGLNYSMMRTIRYEQQGIQDYRLEISNTEVLTFKVRAQSPFVHNILSNLQFRSNWGVTILAIKRGSEIFTNPSGDFLINENDILVVFGSHQDVDKISRA
jgi:CPA2 family monovalent cation:H+ antiporter-2